MFAPACGPAGKFEFGDGTAGSAASPVGGDAGAVGNLGEVLSGGIAAMPAAQAANERQRTKEAQRIIGMVEPGMPQGLGASRPGGSGQPGDAGGGTAAKGKDCTLQ